MSPLLSSLVPLSVALPFAIGMVLLAIRRRSEETLSRVALWGAATWLCISILTVSTWMREGRIATELDFGNIYRTGNFVFPLLLLFDRCSVAFLSVSAVLGTLVIKYCRYYLHREPGYARFFIAIFFFLGGMSLISCAGTFELLFAGWEVVGATSFLLITFYWDRPTPQRNALRAFIVYRLCDVGLLLGAWLEHLVWHGTTTFLDLAHTNPQAFLNLGSLPLVTLSFLVLLAASGKSALFPFSSWLPRAMEGPTPSSAIFYGALSVHAGVLLLIRTYPIWHALEVTRFMVAALGILSAIISTLVGRVQSNIKAQIGYASIAQIGIMLVELSLGLQTLVLFHFAANAVLRCYQLLVSPSVVAHLLRVQSASAEGIQLSDWSFERRWIPKRFQTTFYAFALNEGYLDHLVRSVWWALSSLLQRIFPGRPDRNEAAGLRFAAAIALAGAIAFWLLGPSRILEAAFAVGLVCASMTAIVERRFPHRLWTAVGLAALLACFAVGATGASAASDVSIHLLGIVPSWILGAISLRRLVGDQPADLRWNYGFSEFRPVSSFMFFFSALGISGFPITPAFLGEDLLLHHAIGEHLWLALVITAGFVVNGIVVVRLYTRICLGPPRQKPMQSFGPDYRNEYY